MDKSNIKEKCRKLIEWMGAAGYSKGYVRRYKVGTEQILQLIHSDKIQSYADVYYTYEQSVSNHWKLREMRSILKAIEVLDLHGKYPDGTRNSYLIPKDSYHSLNIEYKAVIDCFVEFETKRGKTRKTISIESSTVAVFLLRLQNSGVKSLSEITESDILSLFISSEGTIIKGYDCKIKLAAVLKACISEYPVCKTILAYLPAFKEKHRNIQYLTAEEIAKVKETLSCSAPNLTLRDRAMGILAIYTGLRSGDIAGLKQSAVDWDEDVLRIHQQKTGVPLTLPLSAIVGNAIWDYITLERPKVENEYVFISGRKPFGRLQHPASMCTVASKIMKVADIRQNSGDRQGFHIFRHKFVTTLLGNGIPRPVINNLTGHLLPESLEPYLSADFPHLKECAISIEKFPVSQEVFSR